jgi:hypothetical protein
MTITRSFSELKRIETFEDRFKYLSLKGTVGTATFGFDRYLNQRFYTSREWKTLRYHVIVRDNGCDLGIEGFEIHNQLLVHHMNPMGVHDLTNDRDVLFDPNFLITTSHRTHNAIHYGDESLLPRQYTPRKRFDTKLW